MPCRTNRLSPCPALLAMLACALLPGSAALGAEASDGHWPQFRGPGARGVAEGHATPTTWNVADGTNVAWRTPIPGLGHSAPVVWGERVFVTSAIGGGDDALKIGLYGDIAPVNDDSVHRFVVYCLDRDSGKILWQRTAFEGVPKVKRHTKSSHANPTPAVDAERVVVSFGSEGLYAYDHDGKLLWQQDLGVLDAGFFMVPGAQWGFGSSPVLHDGTVVFLADVLKGSFLAAFDAKSGKERWRTTRDDVPTWGTPTVYTAGGKRRIAVNGFKHSGGYDLQTGKEVWRMSGGGDIPVPTPFVAHDLIFLTSAHGRQPPLYAVRVAASGDITLQDGATSNEHVAWSSGRDGAYMPTPLVYGDVLYVLKDNGVLSAHDARSGERLYRERLGGGNTGFTASPVAADGKLYVTSEEGDVHVIRTGREFERLGVNTLDEICMATPAISAGRLLFRTRGHVVAIAESKPAQP